jgi:hypothetical protein
VARENAASLDKPCARRLKVHTNAIRCKREEQRTCRELVASAAIRRE